MNSGCLGFNIDVAFKIQIFVRIYSLICFYYFYLSIIFMLYFLYILYVYCFVPRYITTYICMPGDCKLFCLMWRCWYRKKKKKPCKGPEVKWVYLVEVLKHLEHVSFMDQLLIKRLYVMNHEEKHWKKCFYPFIIPWLILFWEREKREMGGGERGSYIWNYFCIGNLVGLCAGVYIGG